MDFFASKLSNDTPFNIIWHRPTQGSITNLANEIKTSLVNLLQNGESIPDIDISFMQNSCLELDQYLLESILPDINKFKRPMSKFIFKSPLNFIMVDEDFH